MGSVGHAVVRFWIRICLQPERPPLLTSGSVSRFVLHVGMARNLLEPAPASPVRAGDPSRLQYLSDRDPTLGGAIQRMADRSGWARWYAAQSFVNSGKPAGEREML